MYLINALERIQYGNYVNNPPSRFISEINSDLLEFIGEKPKQFEEKINIEEKYNNEEEVDLNVGDNVYHEVFGQGKVVSISGSIASIAFKHPYGVKKLLKNHKSISKI